MQTTKVLRIFGLAIVGRTANDIIDTDLQDRDIRSGLNKKIIGPDILYINVATTAIFM